jgi:hypothetical protein
MSLHRRISELEQRTGAVVVTVEVCRDCGALVPFHDDSPCGEHPPAPDGTTTIIIEHVEGALPQ